MKIRLLISFLLFFPGFVAAKVIVAGPTGSRVLMDSMDSRGRRALIFVKEETNYREFTIRVQETTPSGVIFSEQKLKFERSASEFGEIEFPEMPIQLPEGNEISVPDKSRTKPNSRKSPQTKDRNDELKVEPSKNLSDQSDADSQTKQEKMKELGIAVLQNTMQVLSWSKRDQAEFEKIKRTLETHRRRNEAVQLKISKTGEMTVELFDNGIQTIQELLSKYRERSSPVTDGYVIKSKNPRHREIIAVWRQEILATPTSDFKKTALKSARLKLVELADSASALNHFDDAEKILLWAAEKGDSLSKSAEVLGPARILAELHTGVDLASGKVLGAYEYGKHAVSLALAVDKLYYGETALIYFRGIASSAAMPAAVGVTVESVVALSNPVFVGALEVLNSIPGDSRIRGGDVKIVHSQLIQDRKLGAIMRGAWLDRDDANGSYLAKHVALERILTQSSNRTDLKLPFHFPVQEQARIVSASLDGWMKSNPNAALIDYQLAKAVKQDLDWALNVKPGVLK